MPSVFKVVPSGVLLQSWKSNRYIGCCYHCSFPPPQEHRRTWLTSLAIQLAVIPVFFLISCLLTVQKNKRPWPQPLTRPTSTCLNDFWLQNHVITCVFALSELHYSSEIEIIAFPSCVSPGTESVALKLSLPDRWLLIEGWCHGFLASTSVVHILLRR